MSEYAIAQTDYQAPVLPPKVNTRLAEKAELMAACRDAPLTEDAKKHRGASRRERRHPK